MKKTVIAVALCLSVGTIGLAGCNEYAPVPEYVVADVTYAPEIATITPKPPDLW
ncbi:MAG: hypothetical protein FWC70_11390 [Defluviitaleaceae bacterium]|nr:hypothetical protein [Defluviitaleaceae bacterium]